LTVHPSFMPSPVVVYGGTSRNIPALNPIILRRNCPRRRTIALWRVLRTVWASTPRTLATSGDIHVLVVNHRQHQPLAGREQIRRDFEPFARLGRIHGRFDRYLVQGHRGFPQPPAGIEGDTPGDHADPGGESGALRIVGSEEPELIPAQPDEHVLNHIADLVGGHAGRAENAARRPMDHAGIAIDKPVPCRLVARSQGGKPVALRPVVLFVRPQTPRAPLCWGVLRAIGRGHPRGGRESRSLAGMY